MSTKTEALKARLIPAMSSSMLGMNLRNLKNLKSLVILKRKKKFRSGMSRSNSKRIDGRLTRTMIKSNLFQLLEIYPCQPAAEILRMASNKKKTRKNASSLMNKSWYWFNSSKERRNRTNAFKVITTATDLSSTKI